MFTQLPEFVDGYTYAQWQMRQKRLVIKNLYISWKNWSCFCLGLDTDLYPDVDWMDLMLRDGAWSTRASLNMTGGGKNCSLLCRW